MKKVLILLFLAVLTYTLSGISNIGYHKYMVHKTEKELSTCFKEYSNLAKKFKKIACDYTLCQVSMTDPDILTKKRDQCYEIENRFGHIYRSYRSLPIRF